MILVCDRQTRHTHTMNDGIYLTIAIPKLLNHCQLELLNFVILLYLSVYIIMIRPGAVAHYEFLFLHVPTV